MRFIITDCNYPSSSKTKKKRTYNLLIVIPLGEFQIFSRKMFPRSKSCPAYFFFFFFEHKAFEKLELQPAHSKAIQPISHQPDEQPKTFFSKSLSSHSIDRPHTYDEPNPHFTTLLVFYNLYLSSNKTTFSVAFLFPQNSDRDFNLGFLFSSSCLFLNK